MLLLILTFWLLSLPARAAVFTLDCPLPELRYLVIQWLRTRNYSALEEKRQERYLYRIKGERKFQIEIMPDSPLRAKLTVNLPAEEVKDLQKFIRFYLQSDQGSCQYSVVREKIFPPLVCLTAFSGKVSITLSGVLLSPKLILTSAHTLEMNMPVEVVFYDGSKDWAEIIILDPQMDLALLRLRNASRVRYPLKPLSRSLREGEKVEALACPFRELNPRRRGELEGPRIVNGYILWQVHLEVEPGWSGGPVLNEEGELVGIVKGCLRGDKHESFIVPWPLIQKFLSRGKHASEVRALRGR